MKKTVVVACFILAMSISYAQTATQLKIKARARFDKDDYTQALNLINQAISKGPDSAIYHQDKAVYLHFLKKEKEAEVVANEILTLFNDDYDAYYKAAGYFSLVKNFERTIEIYDEAIIKFPTVPNTVKQSFYWYRGGAKAHIMDYEGAYADDFAAYKIDTTSIDAWLNLALGLQQIGKIEESISWYKKVLERQPDNLLYYNNLGWLYDNVGKFAEAEALLNKGIKLMEKLDKKSAEYSWRTHGLMYSNRGWARFKLGDNKGALKDLEKSIELYPSNSYVYKNRALVYISQNKNREACMDLYKSLALGFTDMYGDEVEKMVLAYCR